VQGREIAALTGALLLLTACGGESGSPGTAPLPVRTSEAALPGIEGPPPTASQLVGTWSRIGVAAQIGLRADGTFAIDRTNLDSPYAAGTYEFDRGLIEFTGKGLSCPDAWAWKAGITEGDDPLDDELHIVFVEGGCGVLTGVTWKLARISTG
jgi:hypothetical protein